MRQLPSHRIALWQALFVAFLWSTSVVLIKLELDNIPALTFAGLRYFLAFLCLLPFAFRTQGWCFITKLSRPAWLLLGLLGVVQYFIAQGAHFLSLVYLPAATASLVLSFTPVIVALLALALLSERPTGRQWLGLGICLAGTFLYFYPVSVFTEQAGGLIIVTIGLGATAGADLIGRAVNRTRLHGPLIITVVSMGIGATLLLGTGILIQGIPPLSLRSWLVIAWLAMVNTALAYTLLNVALQTLRAVEISVILNTMLIQVALLAWIFLGESLTFRELFGLVVVTLGTALVQLRPEKAS